MTAEEVDWPFSLKKAELCLGGDQQVHVLLQIRPTLHGAYGHHDLLLVVPLALDLHDRDFVGLCTRHIRIALLISNLWPGLTLGSFSSSSATSAGSSGAQVYSFVAPEREQDQRNSSSTRLSWIIAAIIDNLL